MFLAEKQIAVQIANQTNVTPLKCKKFNALFYKSNVKLTFQY